MIVSEECPNCGEEYKNLPVHWNSCGFPDITDRQIEVLRGSIMGDADLQAREGKNPIMRVSNTNLEYLEYLDSVLGVFSNGVRLQKKKHSGIIEEKNVYRLNTKAHPRLEQFNWYSSGEKRFPQDLTIDLETLKHWYCQDGGLKWNREAGLCYAQIHSKNESDRLDWLSEKLQGLGFDTNPHTYDLSFTRKDTEKLIDSLGEPPDGMEYKWEIYDWYSYKELKP